MVSGNETIVQTTGVTKVFRDFWHRAKVAAVSNLDLEVPAHQVFGLLGPNGSGKSTTIKMILGLLYPTKGFIRVFDRPPTDVAIKARIGFLPEESYLYPFLNARETLDYYGRLFHQGRPERQRRIDMLLDMVGLSAVASRRVGEYSKGMQRRIGLAQALINDPDLLILDEPTSGMDPLGTRQFKDLILELGRRGKTVILSSHLLADVEDVCGRVAILYGGRVRAIGTVADLLAQHSLTQITTERLPEATVARIRRMLQEENRALLDVASPRDKLESLFLRIVEQAQAERVSTGGAVTGPVAEFLRAAPGEGEGEAVIEELVAATERAAMDEQAQPEAPAEPERPQVERDVLAELTRPQEAPPAEEAPAAAQGNGDTRPRPAKPQRPPREQADRDVIDALLGQQGRDE